jgi:hypothetical protein
MQKQDWIFVKEGSNSAITIYYSCGINSFLKKEIGIWSDNAVFVCVHPLYRLSQLTDFHEIWCERYAILSHMYVVLKIS